jgi:hypothetical protein
LSIVIVTRIVVIAVGASQDVSLRGFEDRLGGR